MIKIYNYISSLEDTLGSKLSKIRKVQDIPSIKLNKAVVPGQLLGLLAVPAAFSIGGEISSLPLLFLSNTHASALFTPEEAKKVFSIN